MSASNVKRVSVPCSMSCVQISLVAFLMPRAIRLPSGANRGSSIARAAIGAGVGAATGQPFGGVEQLLETALALAEVFLRSPGQVLSREQLLSLVWGYDFDPGSNVVDVYVRDLRKKLGADRIQTVRGMGYRLVGD